jgi:hypothetical protein
VFGAKPGDQFRQAPVGVRVGEVARRVIEAADEPIANARVEGRARAELLDGCRHSRAELLGGELVQGDADDSEPFRQQCVTGQVVQGRH